MAMEVGDCLERLQNSFLHVESDLLCYSEYSKSDLDYMVPNLAAHVSWIWVALDCFNNLSKTVWRDEEFSICCIILPSLTFQHCICIRRRIDGSSFIKHYYYDVPRYICRCQWLIPRACQG
jgi:hypothetical protein